MLRRQIENSMHEVKEPATAMRMQRFATSNVKKLKRLARFRTAEEVGKSESAGISVMSNLKDAQLTVIEASLIQDQVIKSILLQKSVDLYNVGMRSIGNTSNTTFVVKKSLMRIATSGQEVATRLDTTNGQTPKVNSTKYRSKVVLADVQTFMSQIQFDGSERHLIERAMTRRRETFRWGATSVGFIGSGTLSMVHGIVYPGYREGFIGASSILVLYLGVRSVNRLHTEYVKYKTDKITLHDRPEIAKTDGTKPKRSEVSAIAKAKEASLVVIEAEFVDDAHKRFTELEKAEKLYNTAMSRTTKMRSVSPEVRESIRNTIKEQRDVVANELDMLRTHILKESLDRSRGRISNEMLKKFMRRDYSDGSQEDLVDGVNGRKREGIRTYISGFAMGASALTLLGIVRFNNLKDAKIKDILTTAGLVLTVFSVEQVLKAAEEISKWRVEVRAMKRKPLKREAANETE